MKYSTRLWGHWDSRIIASTSCQNNKLVSQTHWHFCFLRTVIWSDSMIQTFHLIFQYFYLYFEGRQIIVSWQIKQMGHPQLKRMRPPLITLYPILYFTHHHHPAASVSWALNEVEWKWQQAKAWCFQNFPLDANAFEISSFLSITQMSLCRQSMFLVAHSRLEAGYIVQQ